MVATTSLALLILISADLNKVTKDPFDCAQCGVVQPNSEAIDSSLRRNLRIVGGYEASQDAWPWQVAVLAVTKQGNKQLICGGTLINSNFVLTAAHCVTKRMYIVAGEYNLVEAEGYEQERRVVGSFKHPQYNETKIGNDIALLRLESPLELNSKVWPACLPEENEELEPGTAATILGWGAIAYRRSARPGGSPEVERGDMLYQASVPIVGIEQCRRSYGDLVNDLNVICAGYKEGKIDSCQGDSGGGLLIEKNNKWLVYGVTSFGDECAKENAYGIYTKTSNYIGWIQRIVRKFSN